MYVWTRKHIDWWFVRPYIHPHNPHSSNFNLLPDHFIQSMVGWLDRWTIGRTFGQMMQFLPTFKYIKWDIWCRVAFRLDYCNYGKWNAINELVWIHVLMSHEKPLLISRLSSENWDVFKKQCLNWTWYSSGHYLCDEL